MKHDELQQMTVYKGDGVYGCLPMCRSCAKEQGVQIFESWQDALQTQKNIGR